MQGWVPQKYEDQPLLREALGGLEAMGFQLIGAEEVFCDSSGLRTLQLNGLFLNARRDYLFWPAFYTPQKVLLFGVVAFVEASNIIH